MLLALHNLYSQSSFGGGPRYVRRMDQDVFDEPIDREFPIGSGPFSSVNVTPDISAQDLAGGLTPGQLDIAAKQETQEGASIGIFYGELLFGATNVVAHKYEPGPGVGLPRNTFTVIHGEGWGGLGRRGEWEGIVKAWYL